MRWRRVRKGFRLVRQPEKGGSDLIREPVVFFGDRLTVGWLWEGCRESRTCSRDTYPESYITKYTSIRRKSCRENYYTVHLVRSTWHATSGWGLVNEDFIRTSIYDKYSGSTKITTHLDHVSYCKTASDTNWSNRWTYRVFIINTRRD